jgi:hypothetical protein
MGTHTIKHVHAWFLSVPIEDSGDQEHVMPAHAHVGWYATVIGAGFNVQEMMHPRERVRNPLIFQRFSALT